MQTAAQLGLPLAKSNATPRQFIEEFARQDTSGNIDRVLREMVPRAPAVLQAQAKLKQARRDLEQAELNVSYCDVVSEIDGVVTRRNVNPGNNVAVGQQLMVVRSLKEIWVDANFKETQLGDLRIGQPVRLEVDMYGSHREFHGRISGFTMGTGQTLALLPPQNATGNFVVGFLLGRRVDARWLIGGGLLVVAASNYWMARLNLQISPWQVVWPRVLLSAGLGMIFAPLNVAAYLYTPRHLRGAAVGLLALLRNEGGSVGTSLFQTFQQRREQFHLMRLNDFLDPLNPAVQSFSQQARAFFFRHTGDPAGSQQMAWQVLDSLRQEQGASLAYFDVFWIAAVLALGLAVLGFFMKRSVAEKGAHVAE